MRGDYVFRIRLRVEPTDSDVSLSPDRFETTLRRRAVPPGEDGWRFFRDNCWRGEVADEPHLCDLAEESLGVAVESVEFSELVCDREYYDALREAVAADLDAFRADDPVEALGKYLGNSVRIDSP